MFKSYNSSKLIELSKKAKILEKEDLTIINSTHNPNDLLNVDNHIKIKIVDDEGNREITLEEY
mgnify:CR=1 FL=1